MFLPAHFPRMASTFSRTMREKTRTPRKITMFTRERQAGLTIKGPLSSTMTRKPMRQRTKKYS